MKSALSSDAVAKILSLLVTIFVVPSLALADPVRDARQIKNEPKTTIVDLKYQRVSNGLLVCQTYLLIEPPNPVATVLLFVGGRGRLGVSDGGVSVQANNFLFRTRYQFASTGPFNVAVIDAPFEGLSSLEGECSGRASDLRDLRQENTRNSTWHMEDVATVIADLSNSLSSAPIFLVGTSRGSVSAGLSAAVLKDIPLGGVVLTSSVTVKTANRDSLVEVPLESVTVPSLVVSHSRDGCFVTPPSDVQTLTRRLRAGGAPSVGNTFGGGIVALSGSCNALAAHGFFGIEHKMVKFISNWIRKANAN